MSFSMLMYPPAITDRVRHLSRVARVWMRHKQTAEDSERASEREKRFKQQAFVRYSIWYPHEHYPYKVGNN
jgi:hypothetical protein